MIEGNAISEKFEISKHLLQHPTHRIDFNTPTILGTENDTATGC